MRGREVERIVGSRLRLDRLWWSLAVVVVVVLFGREISKPSAFMVAEEFEGFGEDFDDVEDEAEVPFITMPPVIKKSAFLNDPGLALPIEVGEVLKEPRLRGVKGKQVTHSKGRGEQFWDEDEFEGLPGDAAEDQVLNPIKQRVSASSASKQPSALTGPQSYFIEAFSIVFILAYAVFYCLGRTENEKIALSWAVQYAGKDSVFEKNFSLLGSGDGVDSPLLMKEGQNIFKFYASGRRYCEGLLAIMDLQCRHDLIARLWYLMFPREDEVTIEVFMNDEHMDPMVFALARKKNAKSLHKDAKDLKQFATILSAPSQRKWISDELVAIAESRELASDLLTDALLDQVFGEKAFKKYASNFVSLHFTDQNPHGSHGKTLQFKFTIPPSDRIAEISRLVSIVTYFIDVVGRYRLSFQSRARADSARAKIAQEVFKENQVARQEALVKKKEDKRKALEDAENSKITPEALRKREEKDRARQLKKSMPKIKMTRAH